MCGDDEDDEKEDEVPRLITSSVELLRLLVFQVTEGQGVSLQAF